MMILQRADCLLDRSRFIQDIDESKNFVSPRRFWSFSDFGVVGVRLNVSVYSYRIVYSSKNQFMNDVYGSFLISGSQNRSKSQLNPHKFGVVVHSEMDIE